MNLRTQKVFPTLSWQRYLAGLHCRIISGVDCRLNEQAGYWKSWGATEQVFILQVSECQAKLYLNFIDFEKALDSVMKASG